MGWFDIHPHNGLRNIFPVVSNWVDLAFIPTVAHCPLPISYPDQGSRNLLVYLNYPSQYSIPAVKGIPGWLGKYKDWLNQIVANSNLGHLEEVVCNYSHQSANAGFDLRLILSADIANCTESLRTCFRIWQSNNIFLNHIVMKYSDNLIISFWIMWSWNTFSEIHWALYCVSWFLLETHYIYNAIIKPWKLLNTHMQRNMNIYTISIYIMSC